MIRNDHGDDPKSSDMFNMIHIDEKWFYITKKAKKFYLVANERDPARAVKSKKNLTKIMFPTAMARPRFDSNGNETFTGKIEIFPFVTEQPTKEAAWIGVQGLFKQIL